ncbi:MAG: prenyltransferase [Woeseiaceae bacterium]|nr:prenyltransferase [Woeseiaceae bacterium]
MPSTGPDADDFAGESPGQLAKRLFNATRPKFFPASVLPVVAGTAWGYAVTGAFDWYVAILALFATVCVHASANVLNDVGDESGGTDRINEQRIYPYTGGSRFIQAGIMSASAMARLGVSLIAVAAVAGAFLIIEKGLFVLWLGLAGVLLTVLYSLGPVRLSSVGLGELAVGVGLGVIPVAGAAWLQSGVFDMNAVLFSIPIAMWVTAILLINEVPDVAADSATGKGTLPVRFGLRATAGIYFGLHLAAFAAVAWLAWQARLPLLAPAVPLLLLVLALRSAAAIPAGVGDRAAMTRAIEGTLGIHTLGSLWLAGCALYVAFWGGG